MSASRSTHTVLSVVNFNYPSVKNMKDKIFVDKGHGRDITTSIIY
jgi:hypothetical protein